jgi:hypothetical protein
VGSMEERHAPTAGTRHDPAVPRIGRFQVEHIDHGMSATGGSTTPADFVPGKWTGWSTPEERRAYFRQTASASLPGRAANPSSKSSESGPQYNRLLQHVWGAQKFPGRGGSPPAPPPPKPNPPGKPPKPAPEPKPKPVPPVAFTSIDDVEAWAKRRFPWAKVEVKGIAVDSWNVIREEIDYLVDKFPGISDRMGNFGSVDTKDNTIALASPESGRTLKFNGKWFNDLKQLARNVTNGVAKEFYPIGVDSGGARYCITHEIGHLVDGLLAKTDPKTHDALMAHFKDPDGKFDARQARRVSSYGATDPVEAFAETFAAARWRTDQKNPIVEDFKKRLQF